MALTGKQTRHLQQIGQKLKASCIVGKAGLSASALDDIQRQLGRHELVKVRIPPAGPGNSRRAMGEQLAEATGAVCVKVLGRTVLLYRQGPQSSQRDD